MESEVRTTPLFVATGAAGIAIRAGALINGRDYAAETPVRLPAMQAGTDYAIIMEGGEPIAVPAIGDVPTDAIGGFHFAPGGNAAGRSGGDETPAINPLSIWDAAFRPACADPRGMTLVETDGKRFWVDIYLLGTEHLAKGTSRHGETVADGYDLPDAAEGGKAKKLDHATAVAIYAHHGKALLGYDEFRAAAFGVTERTSTLGEPKKTGLDAARTSRFGLMQATGNMWVWGTDGDPDEPRPSIFGGSWIFGADSGSRHASLDFWPDFSFESLSARGRCDHLQPDAGAKAPA